MCQSKDHGGKRCPSSMNSTARHAYYLHSREGRSPAYRERIENFDAAREKYGDIVHELRLPLPEDTANVVDVLKNKGLTPYIVGGSVRDALNGTTPDDLDVEIHGGSLNQVLDSVKKLGSVATAGKSFGVLKLHINDSEIDLSVPRKENRVGTGHRGFEVEFDPDMSLEEAAQRRDFTINAVYYDPQLKVAVDPFNGVSDLKNKKLRHVSDAFDEDPLRVMRAVQFASRFDLDLDEDTANKCRSLLVEAQHLAPERLYKEWDKFFKSDHPNKGLDVLEQTGWDSIVPGLEVSAAREALAKLPGKSSIHSRRASFIGSILDDTKREAALQKIVDSNNDKHAVRRLLTSDKEYGDNIHALSRAILPMSVSEWAGVQKSIGNARADHLLEAATKAGVSLSPREQIVTGKLVLSETGSKGGQWVGRLLKDAQKLQDEGVIASNIQAVEWVRENWKNYA